MASNNVTGNLALASAWFCSLSGYPRNRLPRAAELTRMRARARTQPPLDLLFERELAIRPCVGEHVGARLRRKQERKKRAVRSVTSAMSSAYWAG